MAEREFDTAAEQMAAELRSEAELLRKNVPEAFRVSDRSALNDTFLPVANADAFDEEISAVHREEAEFIRRTFEQQRAGASNTGARELGSVADQHGQTTERDGEKRERERLHRLMRLLDTLRDINDQIAANNQALEAIERIRELRAQGKFDPQKDEHRRLLDTAGISVSEYERDGETALDRRQRELNDENRRLQERRRDTTDELRTDHGLTEEQIEEKMRANFTAAFDQRDIQIQNNAGGIEITDTSVTEYIDQRRMGASSTEHELEQFVVAFARAQRIEDGVQRLAAEKVLVDSLSEDAQLLALGDDTVKHVFDDGYFDALEALEGQSAQFTPTKGGPSI